MVDDILFTDNDFLIYSTIHQSDETFLAPVWPVRISEGMKLYEHSDAGLKAGKHDVEMKEKLANLSDLENANPFIIEFEIDDIVVTH